MKYASMKKSIYSMIALRKVLRATNNRYLDFLSAIDDRTFAMNKLNKVCKPIGHNNRNHKGLIF